MRPYKGLTMTSKQSQMYHARVEQENHILEM